MIPAIRDKTLIEIGKLSHICNIEINIRHIKNEPITYYIMKEGIVLHKSDDIQSIETFLLGYNQAISNQLTKGENK